MDSRKSEASTLDLAPSPNGWLERLFKLRLHGTTVKTELIAGLTTFITMAYIIFVNPNIMADAGIDHGAAFVATCIAAALGCLLMGLYANWPVGLAPTWMAMDVAGVFNVSMISVVFAFLFVHMFDTAGTLMGVAQRAGLVNADGKIDNLSRALKADSASSVFGAVVGVPP
ncbi:hypothetical protein HT121_31735, partial [Pseudomonas sp. MAFF 301514]|uniref:solute carrier family 23 protein n=1 Tax=Pseudomonas allii TaxID=2740531 RepID=UPI001847B8BC|nr:hypothetical protein [Pseudomonas allii]